MRSDALYFLEGGGTAALNIAAVDWSATPLGAIETWGPGLRTAVGMMLASRFPKAIVWGPELHTLHNDAFALILGDKPEAQGRPFPDVWREAWAEIGPIVARALAGEAVFIEDFPLVINRFGYPERCNFTFCYSPIRDETGAVAGMMDTVIETTGRVESQRRLEVLNAELAHRMRNTMAIVSAIATQTLKTQTDTREASRALTDRLRALAGTHELLGRGGSVEADVETLVRAGLAPHVGDLDRVSFTGVRVPLPERQALALALAVNELATNAVKHGALTVPTGRVEIGWSVAPEGDFDFAWRERDGPVATGPKRISFGTILLERIVPADFQGTGRHVFGPEGIEYHLVGHAGRAATPGEDG
ncbi:MAG: histidine kinase [Rhodovulum sulfidophilum]|uniref:histidine kinase n=1 Tax=Rhodovulum sulfidophilum TaxID=35806 RepID=A0A2W5NGZ0_RHOSU|nr:MAG: histidine kinase [Rhodovulum sulfidophilum]